MSASDLKQRLVAILAADAAGYSRLMAADEVKEQVDAIREDVLTEIIDRCIPPGSLEEQWDVPGLEAAVAAMGGN